MNGDDEDVDDDNDDDVHDNNDDDKDDDISNCTMRIFIFQWFFL